MAPPRYADAVTLDQLELLVAVVDVGSFTKAAKQLGRAQSAVSYGVKRLEELLSVELLERSLAGARPTRQGQILVAEAREVLGRVDRLRAAGRAFSEKIEPEVSISLTPIYPLDTFAAITRDMRERFPHTELRVLGGNLGANVEDVMSGRTTLGVSGLPDLPSDLVVVPCGRTIMSKVVGPNHPLAKHRGEVRSAELRKHLQLVALDLTSITSTRQFNVISPRTWRIADTMLRYKMVLAGAGWTHFARAWVDADIKAGRLVELRSEKNAPPPFFTMRAFYRTSAPPGPAGHWLLERLCNAAASPSRLTRAPGKSRRRPRRE